MILFARFYGINYNTPTQTFGILQHWSRALSPQDDNVVIYLGHRYKDTEV